MAALRAVVADRVDLAPRAQVPLAAAPAVLAALGVVPLAQAARALDRVALVAQAPAVRAPVGLDRVAAARVARDLDLAARAVAQVLAVVRAVEVVAALAHVFISGVARSGYCSVLTALLHFAYAFPHQSLEPLLGRS